MKLVPKLLEIARESDCEDLAEVERLLTEAAEARQPLIRVIYESALVDENKFVAGLSKWLGLPVWDSFVEQLPAHLREIVPARISLKHHLLPGYKALKAEDLTHTENAEDASDDDEAPKPQTAGPEAIIPSRSSETEAHGAPESDTGAEAEHTFSSAEPMPLICYDPFDIVARQVVAQSVDTPVRWYLATRILVLEGLRQGYGVGAETFDMLLEGRDPEDMAAEIRQETTLLDQDDDEASVIKFVNQIFREALELRATDIHLEPLEDDLRIRYRIDGMLIEVPVPDKIKLLQSSVIARLKIMAHLDIAERRLPQDGRIPLQLQGQDIDVRVAVIPSVNGESVSLRLLTRQSYTLERLNMEKHVRANMNELLEQPNGIVLVTGPTGSGKSTTLYSLLSVLNTEERRIVTIEDPVEYKLSGIVQIAVKPEIDLTFARGLRRILRGDPNVFMVGEMRDFETAEIAIRGALTGHLVFSTLHTNDSVGGITRLIDMGVEPFLVASSVRAFLAQRLVRTLCHECKQPTEYPVHYLQSIGFPKGDGQTLYRPVGCTKCRQSGYTGRMAIYEVCMITERMQDLISASAPPSELKAAALADGMEPLRRYGWKKVLKGETTIEEVLRATTADQAQAEEEEKEHQQMAVA